MTLSDYLGPRIFRSPYRRISETVGIHSVLATLFLGPVYLWRKGAMVEGLLLSLVSGALFILPGQGLLAGLPDPDAIGLVLWVGTAVAAPVLLALSYARRGWIER